MSDDALIIEFNDLPEDTRRWLLDEAHANNFDLIEIVNIADRHDGDDEWLEDPALDALSDPTEDQP